MNNFNFPTIDHLIEGVHYTIVDWNFADGQGCPEGEKMVFGMCRKVGGGTGEKDFDSSKKTQQETEGEAEATKQGSSAKNNKAVMVKNKKMGWAIKDGKPVLVEWGSVAGEKKVGPKQPAEKPKKPKRSGGSPASGSNAERIQGLKKALENPDLNEAARAAIQKQIEELG